MGGPSTVPPIPGLAGMDALSWSIPGLREDPTMCLRCRSAQLLCGKPVCPILLQYHAFERTLPLVGGNDLEGSSPPGVFVGRYGYPKVSFGPLLAPQHGSTELLDSPEDWVGRSVSEVVSFRLGLVRGTAPIRVTDAHLAEALDQLLDARGQLTRKLLGGRGTAGQDAVIRPMGADAVIRRSEALILQPRKKPSRAQPS